MSLFAKISTYDERSARLAGIGLMLLSIFMFSFGDALGKFMVATYSVGQLMWLRACAALLVLLPIIWQQRAEFKRIERPWLQLLRVLLSTLLGERLAGHCAARIRSSRKSASRCPSGSSSMPPGLSFQATLRGAMAR